MKAVFVVEANKKVSHAFFQTEKGDIAIENHQEAFDSLQTNEKRSSKEMEDGSYHVEIETGYETEVILHSTLHINIIMDEEEYIIDHIYGVRFLADVFEHWLAAIHVDVKNLYAEVNS